MEITLDNNALRLISLFESSTGARVRDCVNDGSVLFVVEPGDMSKAIGKAGSNIRRLENILKKRVRVVEFATEAVQFAKNLAGPLGADVVDEAGILRIIPVGLRERGFLIGRGGENLRALESLIKRHFTSVKELQVGKSSL